MGGKKERTCIQCNQIEMTHSTSPICSACYALNNRNKNILLEQEHVVKLGYEILSGPHTHETHGKRAYEVKRLSCGHSWTLRYDNLLKALKSRPETTPCKVCGGSERMKSAHTAFMKIYAQHDQETWCGYRKQVQSLSDKNYKSYKHIINPNNLIRGKKHYELDHKISIIFGFNNNVPADEIAKVANLQMLWWEDNASKGRGCIFTGDKILDTYLSEYLLEQEMKKGP